MHLNTLASSSNQTRIQNLIRLLVVSIRTPNLGIGGSVLCGGFSWLSGEFGCASDPLNMLDAQVVKLDGTATWASVEPELLWALRGTEGSFASQ